MKILLSNDDGATAPGLQMLFKKVSELPAVSDVTVVAPDRDCSAVSNSLTITNPIRINQQPNGFYAVTGTPTDCVHIAITGFLDNHPDMIISGINDGANLGDDLLYSGTVAAAMEGRFLGYPAIAISLVREDKSPAYFETAAMVIMKILDSIQKNPLPQSTILNINVPNCAFEDIRGIQVTRLGHRHCAENVETALDPKGKTIYWIGPAGKAQDAGPGTDFYAIEKGFVSVTPIKVDLTDYASLDTLKHWSESLNWKK